MKIRCTNCRKHIKRSIGQMKLYKNHFCSNKCRHSLIRSINHHAWVGIGKPYLAKAPDGMRWKIQVNGKTLRYSRYLMAKKLGRPLKKNEVIHHIDYDKTNDKINNLQVIDRGKHTFQHHKNIPKPILKTGKYINCPQCNKIFYRNIYRLSAYKHNFCSQSCSAIFRKPRLGHSGQILPFETILKMCKSQKLRRRKEKFILEPPCNDTSHC